jgi:uncharacterized coiled-coil protein SlyX
MPSLFERVVSSLFGSPGPSNEVDRELIDETIEAFVDIVEPRVRLSSRYRDKLAGPVADTIGYLRELGALLPRDPIVLGRGAWSEDPRVRAFFGAADDVSSCIGRCDEVREFFDSHADCTEIYALLGMQRRERTVLAPRLEGDVLRQDVQQTTVSFSDHRLLAPAQDLAQSRLDVGRRILQRLAQLVLARIVGINEQVQDLQMKKAKLATRLRMLRSARDGMQPLVSEGLTTEQQIRDVERELQQTADDYTEARVNLATLDGYIDHINAVLSHPQQQVSLTRMRMRLSRMGVKLEAGQGSDADELDLAELSIGEGLRATISFVRIARDELPPKEDLLSRAQRAL